MSFPEERLIKHVYEEKCDVGNIPFKKTFIRDSLVSISQIHRILEDAGLLYDRRVIIHPGTTKPFPNNYRPKSYDVDRNLDFNNMNSSLKGLDLPIALETLPAVNSFELSLEALSRIISINYGSYPKEMITLLNFLRCESIPSCFDRLPLAKTHKEEQDVECLLDITHTMVAGRQYADTSIPTRKYFNSENPLEITKGLLQGFTEFCLPIIHFSGIPYDSKEGFLVYDRHSGFRTQPNIEDVDEYEALVQAARGCMESIYDRCGRLTVVLEIPCSDRRKLEWDIRGFMDTYNIKNKQ